MATSETGTPTPPQVDAAATQQARLPRIALIGIFGSEADPRALIRDSNGKISRVGVGDEAAGGIVAAIGDAKVIIARRNNTTVLEMPTG